MQAEISDRATQRIPTTFRVCAVFLAACLLAACGGGSSSRADPETAPPENLEAALPVQDPNSYDLRIWVDIRDEVDSVQAIVRGGRVNADINPSDVYFDAVISGDATWVVGTQRSNCEPLVSDATGRTLRCHDLFYGLEGPFENHSISHPHYLYIHANVDTEIRVDVFYGEHENDRNLSNNQHFATVSHVEDPPASYTFKAEIEHSFGSSREPTVDKALQGHVAKGVWIRGTPQTTIKNKTLRVRANIPENTVVVSAEYVKRSYGSSLELFSEYCHVSDEVECTVDGVGEIEVLVKLVTIGDGPVVLDYELSEIENDGERVVARTQLPLLNNFSMSSIQALIDNAEDGDTLELPPGIFAGALDARGKILHFVGASLEEGTTLIAELGEAPLVHHLGPRSTLSNLTLQSSGNQLLSGLYGSSNAPGANITIADSVITPVPSRAHRIENGLIDNDTLPAFRLLRNEISGWGNRDDSVCRTLFHLSSNSGGSAWPGPFYSYNHVYLQNNRFLWNDCDSLMTERGVHSLSLTNNAFVSSPVVLRGLKQQEIPPLVVRNNVFLSGAPIFDYPDLAQRSQISTASNLIWGKDANELLSDSDLVTVNVEKSDVIQDPMLVDGNSGDLNVYSESPLIDSGVFPGEYRWHKPQINSECFHSVCWQTPTRYEGDVYPQPENAVVFEPLDGNGDGAALYDIGPSEIQR